VAAKTLHQSASGQTFKLGRKRPVARCPRFALKNYLMRSMPAPPPTYSYQQAAAAALSEVYENDTLGDCVIAGMAHVVGVLTGNSGTKPFLYSDEQIIKLYSALVAMSPVTRPQTRGVMNRPPSTTGRTTVRCLPTLQTRRAHIGSPAG
jgi:hypothetical protein